MHTIGYIGLGNIGKPMCASLIKHVENAEVLVYDVFPEPVQEMVALGGIAAASPAEIAERCDMIGVCVRDDNDVENLLYDSGMLAAMGEGTIIAIHSTVTRDNVLRWAKECAAKGISLLDAGISGGAQGAADATLCIMVGGEEAAVERAAPMFKATSKEIVYCGQSGNGIVVKLANNLMTYQSFVAAHEGVALVKALGIDAECLFDVGRANGVLQPSMLQFITGREALLAACSREEVQPMFAPPCGLGHKDLGHALELGKQHGLNLTQTEQALANLDATFVQD